MINCNARGQDPNAIWYFELYDPIYKILIYFFFLSGELAPATAFMTGKVKVSGDLSKALTLEKVMKATREAAEASRNKQG